MSANKLKEIVKDLRNNSNSVLFGSKFRRFLSTFLDVGQEGSLDILGLDIGPDRIKLLKINTTVSPHQVENYASVPLPAGVMVKDEIKNPAAISAALRDMLRQSGITTKGAAVAIPRTLAIIKNITVDKRFGADEIESRAWIEANRLFPDLVGNIYLDFMVTGPSLQGMDQLDLLLVACRKEHIKPYLDIITQAGLVPRIVDVNCYALERALQLSSVAEEQPQTVALLNVNLTQSSMIVMHKQQLIHAHDQTFDGHRLLKQVEDFIAAKHQEPGMENSPIVDDDAAYHALLQENFLSHLRHTIHFFYSSRSNITIDEIMLAGDCTIVPDFSNFIAKEIGVKTVMANPFKNMTISNRLNADDLTTNAATLMLCSGLALSVKGE